MEEEILANPDISAEFRTFEELLLENSFFATDSRIIFDLNL